METLCPDLTRIVTRQMMARRMSVKEGVRRLVESVPSARYDEIVAYSRTLAIRPGLLELLDFLDARGARFVLVSGGLKIMVTTVLGPLVNRFAGLFALDLDTRGKNLKIQTLMEGETELLAKRRVMERFAYEQSVAIGDGYTDREMALFADVAFARDGLARFLEKMGRSYIPWEDFHTVTSHLERLWEKE